jgi:hypothetical protein
MDINNPETVAEVTAAFAQYEAALITAGAATLDRLFWDSPLTIRYGAGETLYGVPAIRAFNAKRQPLGPARSLKNTVITTFGGTFATVSTLFVDVPRGKIGRQQQCWVRLPEGWRVVAAHVSVIDDEPERET